MCFKCKEKKININFSLQKLTVKTEKDLFYTIFSILFQIFLAHEKNSTSRNKDILNTVQVIELTKNEDFDHFLRRILPPQK